MTYEELMAAIRAEQQRVGSYTPQTWVGTDSTSGYWMPSTESAQTNYVDLGNGQVAFLDPTTNQIMVTDQNTGTEGIARTQYNPDGTVTQLPFEAMDRTAKWNRGATTGLLSALSVAGAGALAGGGGAGGAAGDFAAANTGGTLADYGVGSAVGSGSGAAAAPAAGDFFAANTGGTAAQYGVGGTALAGGATAAGAAGTAGTAGGTAAGAGASMLPRLADGSVDWGRVISDPRLISAALGAGAAIAGNSDITSSRSTTSSLAPWLQQNAQELVARTGALSSGPQTNGALDTSRNLLTGYATQGDPLVNSAMSQQQNVIGGGMLGSNPYIDRVAQGIGDRMGEAYATGTRAGTFSTFNNDGNSVMSKSGFGQVLSNQDRAFGDSLGQTMSNLYYGNYANERAAQDAAARSSINFGNFGVQNAQNLANVGQADWQRPFQANVYYGNAINPAYGSTSTSTQNISAPNNFLAGAGGAAAGLGIWDQIFNNQRRP